MGSNQRKSKERAYKRESKKLKEKLRSLLVTFRAERYRLGDQDGEEAAEVFNKLDHEWRVFAAEHNRNRQRFADALPNAFAKEVDDMLKTL